MRISFRENLIPSKPYSVRIDILTKKETDRLADEERNRLIIRCPDKLIDVEIDFMSNLYIDRQTNYQSVRQLVS